MTGAVLVRWGFTVSGSKIIPSLAVGLLCPFTLTPKLAYWYVPDDYLLAYRYTNLPEPKVEAVVDQTVWHLTKANEGYLLGCSFRTTSGGNSWSTSKIVGSVAPNDQVVMGFNSGKIINVATGTLISSRGHSVFLMQVAGTPPESSLTHWAYMVQVTPNDAAWWALPGTDDWSVDQLVENEPGCVVDPE